MLAIWCREAGLISDSDAGRLRAPPAQRPGGAAEVLELALALALRTAYYQAVRGGGPCSPGRWQAR